MENDYEAEYERFWKAIVENPDGTLNLDQIKRELYDFSFLMEQASTVYESITDGRLSKTTHYASSVLQEHEDVLQERFEDYVDDEIVVFLDTHGIDDPRAGK
jgi:hypothetical protein